MRDKEHLINVKTVETDPVWDFLLGGVNWETVAMVSYSRGPWTGGCVDKLRSSVEKSSSSQWLTIFEALCESPMLDMVMTEKRCRHSR